MSTELYKTHRPSSFKQVMGNRATVSSLRTMVKRKTLPHTILFSGPSGCGKTTMARILADKLNCHDVDLTELNCSSFRGIDTIRDIMRLMTLSPVGGTTRVWIMDEVHQLSRDAQNSALKMLEDTPNHVYFILCTTDPQKLLPTIRSRCTPMPMSRLTVGELETLVANVAKSAGVKVEDGIVNDIADFADGSPRVALVSLNKVRYLDHKDRAKALKTLGDDDTATIDLCKALIKGVKWPVVAKILRNMKDDPEKVRWGVLGYARSVLLGGKGSQSAYNVICAFEGHFYDSKTAGLARACWESMFAD